MSQRFDPTLCVKAQIAFMAGELVDQEIGSLKHSDSAQTTYAPTPAGTECRALAADETGVAAPVDLIVVNLARAIAEADLCPQVQIDVAPAIGRLTPKR
jgi:hypothetical protein